MWSAKILCTHRAQVSPGSLPFPGFAMRFLQEIGDDHTGPVYRYRIDQHIFVRLRRGGEATQPFQSWVRPGNHHTQMVWGVN
ncbi:hypothetical protein JOE21_002220 [Desmospora profundinema]|uniref:Uncharacterized protein n=1 Tax=Desmospora profundinema TaxID=1571184 RepID=A0ABU1IQL4_9BACL|nr:hypothetical protein [Desmospora profundinema]